MSTNIPRGPASHSTHGRSNPAASVGKAPAPPRRRPFPFASTTVCHNFQLIVTLLHGHSEFQLLRCTRCRYEVSIEPKRFQCVLNVRHLHQGCILSASSLLLVERVEPSTKHTEKNTKHFQQKSSIHERQRQKKRPVRRAASHHIAKSGRKQTCPVAARIKLISAPRAVVGTEARAAK